MSQKTSAIPAPEIFSSDNLRRMDETVREVFGTMLGMEVAGVARSALFQEIAVCPGDHSAFIGFAGAICGHCEINLSLHASAAIASAMLGGADVDPESDDVCDAIGELCNMLAGGWKDRLPTLAANCHLSIPVRSCDLHSHTPGNDPSTTIGPLDVNRRSYTFGNKHTLTLTLAHRRVA